MAEKRKGQYDYRPTQRLHQREAGYSWDTPAKEYAQRLLPFLQGLLGLNFHTLPDEEILRRLNENYEEIKEALRHAGYNGNLFAMMVASIVNHVREERGLRSSVTLFFLARGLDHHNLLSERYPHLLPEGIHRWEDRKILKHIFNHYEEIEEALRELGYEGKVPGATFMHIIHALRAIEGLEGVEHSQELNWLAYHLDVYFQLKKTHSHLVPEDLAERSEEEILRHVFDHYPEIVEALETHGHSVENPAEAFAHAVAALQILRGRKKINLRKAYYVDLLIASILGKYPTLEDLRQALEEAKRTASPTTVIEIPLEEIYGRGRREGGYGVREEEPNPLVALLRGSENMHLRSVARKVFPEKDVDKIVERWRHIYEWWKRRKG